MFLVGVFAKYIVNIHAWKTRIQGYTSFLYSSCTDRELFEVLLSFSFEERGERFDQVSSKNDSVVSFLIISTRTEFLQPNDHFATAATTKSSKPVS